MLSVQAAHDVLPFTHRPILTLANYSQLLAAVLAIFEIIDVLLDTLLRLQALELTRRALCVDVRKFVLVHAGSRLFEETSSGTAVNGRFPIRPALLMR